MGFGKEARIITLLVIDVVFFLVEIIVGYSVGSLALVADSFHMLNDVMSLVVALYALRLSTRDHAKDPRYSYGWQRAEILGALVNGVFLLALCFSIFMEAIERAVNITEVSNPKLVVIVGSLGLASNIVGLFLFHDHGHSHGGHSHGHSHGTKALPSSTSGAGSTAADNIEERAESEASAATVVASPSANGRRRQDSVSSLFGHPATTRAYVVKAAQELGYEQPARGERERLNTNAATGSSTGYGSTVHAHDIESGHAANATKKGRSWLGQKSKAHAHAHDEDGNEHSQEHGHSHDHSDEEHGHSHNHGGDGGHSHGGHGHSHGGHSHSHGSMNMQGVFLHVLGDALGNVGVIASGLFILLTTYSWRFYTDPAISFLITIIIFHSALPLVKSASFILLQGVPPSVPLDDVRAQLVETPGVLSIHELHVWQLSESTIIASMHVLVDCGPGQDERYMQIAQELRTILHSWGVHAATIQPEFVRGGLKTAARMSGVNVAPEETDAQGRLITEEGTLVESELVSASSSPAAALA
ncbi:cation efflux protein [Ceraceosorus guamensis]|uniref:Cation efflux protein n=1 Tax=Ceraceosorus guamensis TaxID=1522189 RepID=A0A316VY98_9BASI|nr:cation efflux protein [Ceraceosorus guamensis]PWN41271.1 cation efflux protein [Ceraceosorus guamensis]